MNDTIIFDIFGQFKNESKFKNEYPVMSGYGDGRYASRLSDALRKWQGRTRTNDDAASAFSVSKSTFVRWKNMETAPDVNELERICAVTGLLPNDLLGVSDASHLNASGFNYGSVPIPILDVRAGAGVGIDNHLDEILSYLPFPDDYLKKLGIKSSNVRAIRACGDSMESTIADGQLVLLDTVSADMRDGRIYALRTIDGLRLKRIQRQIDGNVLLISDNRNLYLPEVLTKEEAQQVSVLGRAFWTERLL